MGRALNFQVGKRRFGLWKRMKHGYDDFTNIRGLKTEREAKAPARGTKTGTALDTANADSGC
jgi:hypothetical protein